MQEAKMKKFMDDPSRLVEDMLAGYVKAYPQRVTLRGTNVLCRAKPKDKGKVAVIIGNGSGHEPGMIDLVGEGLFDANICGNIFTAPSPIRMMEGVRAVSGDKGVLILVSSHAGDILNAKMTLMLARAEGIDARMAVLWDDISSAPKGRETERRGGPGLFFTFKIVCAAAEAGWEMDDLIQLAYRVRDNTRTLSVAVSGGTHPQTGLKTFELPEDEIEVGMGVHGEAGSGRMKMTTASGIAACMLDQLLADKPFLPGDEVMVLLNNSGATTRMELMILYGAIESYLAQRGIKAVRCWIGAYVTTQEAAGFSLSLCRADEQLLALYDAPADSILF